MTGGWFDADGVYHPNTYMEETYENDWESEAVMWETYEGDMESEDSVDSEDSFDHMDLLEDAVESYGYDQDTVQAWLEDRSASW